MFHRLRVCCEFSRGRKGSTELQPQSFNMFMSNIIEMQDFSHHARGIYKHVKHTNHSVKGSTSSCHHKANNHWYNITYNLFPSNPLLDILHTAYHPDMFSCKHCGTDTAHSKLSARSWPRDNLTRVRVRVRFFTQSLFIYTERNKWQLPCVILDSMPCSTSKTQQHFI